MCWCKGRLRVVLLNKVYGSCEDLEMWTFSKKSSTCWSLCSNMPTEMGRYEDTDQRLPLQGEGAMGEGRWGIWPRCEVSVEKSRLWGIPLEQPQKEAFSLRSCKRSILLEQAQRPRPSGDSTRECVCSDPSISATLLGVSSPSSQGLWFS